MCLGVPARVLKVDGNLALVSIGGIEYQASLLLLPDVHAGDFILLHAGFAIEKVNETNADETNRLIEEIENGFGSMEDNNAPAE